MKFRLRCLEDVFGNKHINTWFAVALTRNVRWVMGDVSQSYIDNPLLLHSCTTLEILDLGSDLCFGFLHQFL